jgi:hypothetical protein
MRWLERPIVRWGLLLITFTWIAWALADQWQAMRLAATDLRIAWRWVIAGSIMVLTTYAVLIQSWRMLLRGMGSELSYGAAVRIWTIANLGRWIPGKVWSVGALGVLAAREGVSGTAAAGAALLGTVLNIGAGFGISVVTGARGLDAVRPGLSLTATWLAVLFVIGVATLPWMLPPTIRRLGRWRGTASASMEQVTALPAVTVWAATFINAAAWVGYGVAFAFFARGVTPGISGDPSMFIAVFTTSYLIGYLALFAPGGLGIREYALVALLIAFGVAGNGEAVILSATSRVWLTVLEVVPGIISLFWLPPSQRAALRQSG